MSLSGCFLHIMTAYLVEHRHDSGQEMISRMKQIYMTLYLLLGHAVVHHSLFSQMMLECKNLLAYQLLTRLANIQVKKPPCKIVNK